MTSQRSTAVGPFPREPSSVRPAPLPTQDGNPTGINAGELFGGALIEEIVDPLDQVRIRTYRIPTSQTQVRLEIEYNDLRGGYIESDDVEHGANKVATNTLMATHRRRLILPHLTTVNSVTGGATNAGAFNLNIFGTLAMAQGATANQALAIETSATNQAIAFRTYTPGSAITGLYEIITGGAGTARQLALCRAGGAIEVLSDLAATPTSTGTMHADTNPAWGVIITGVNNTTAGTPMNLLYISDTISRLSSADAIGTQPIVVLDGIPGGGYALGLEQLDGEPRRAHWVWPLAHRTISCLAAVQSSGAPTPVQHVSTNEEGSDPWYSSFPLDSTFYPILWNRSVVATNGHQIVAYKGSNRFVHLASPIDAATDSTVRQVIVSLGNNRGTLLALIAKFGISDRVVDSYHLRRYLPRLNTWVDISGAIPIGATGNGSANGPLSWPELESSTSQWGQTPGLAISSNSGFVHFALNRIGLHHEYMFLEPRGIDSFITYQGIASFEASGTATLPYLDPPWPLRGLPLLPDQIGIGGDVNAAGTSGTDGYVEVEITGATPAIGAAGAIRFIPGFANTWQWADVSNATQVWQIRPIIYAARNTGTTTATPNCFPLIVRARCTLPADLYESYVNSRVGGQR